MPAQRPPHVSPQDYLDADRQAERKSEYLDGDMFAMAGASYAHNVIVANLVADLHAPLKGRDCTVTPSDLRLGLPSGHAYFYPDVMVICGRPEFADEHQDTILNPTLIVEVLSEATKNYDRGEKFFRYRTLPSLRHYLLVAQDSPRVEHFAARPDGTWLLTELQGHDAVVELAELGCRVGLRAMYEKVG